MADIKPDLHAIFHQAVELDSPEQIVQYLDNACGDDRELRGEVEALISSHRGAGDFLGGSASRATVDLRPSEKPGTQIGRYKLLQQIGEGGMGTVYMAEQLNPVQRMVALKVVKAGLDSQQIVARFEAERQSLAMMDHPNIAKVLDAGETERGEPYFVMELVKGVPIKQYCDDNRLSTRDRIKLIVDVCSAVQHAHQKGIIHRDLKPSNILVAQYDDRPVPKVIDFGVAKATHQKLTEKTLYTQLGQIVGTLEYMSPEQAVLNQLDVDTRTDVYSLGVILYELMVGETPLSSKTLRSQGLEQMLRTIREQEPPRPSLRLSSQGAAATQTAAYQRTNQNSLSKTLRGDLDWIVMKALEKDRKRRYDSASRLSEDLSNYLGGEAVDARPPTLGYRLRKNWQRNRILVSSTAAVIVALLLGFAGILWENRQKGIALRQLSDSKSILQKTNRNLEATTERLQATLDGKQQEVDKKEEALSWVRDYCMLLAMTGEPDDKYRAVQIAEMTKEPEEWLLALRGTAEMWRGNDHEAVELLKNGLEFKPKDIVLTGLLAVNYATTGDFRKYLEASAELESLAEEASDEELIYAGWGFISQPQKALGVIRRVETRRGSPLIDLAFAAVASSLAMETRETLLIEEAIRRLEASRNFLGDTPQFYEMELRLRYAAMLYGSNSPEDIKILRTKIGHCIKRFEAISSSSFTLMLIASYYHRFGTDEQRHNAWEKLLHSKNVGGYQTYAIKALTLRTGDYREAAEALEGNPSTYARLWQAICLHNTDEHGRKKADELYQEIKHSREHILILSHLHFLEHVGPLQRLKEESLEYLKSPEFPSKMAEAKATFCAEPSPKNEKQLRELGRDNGILLGSALYTIARVRILQAKEATPSSDRQEGARNVAILALNECLRTGDGRDYWAESMKQVLTDEWAQADLSQ